MEYEIESREDLIRLFRDLGYTRGAEIGVWFGKFSQFIHETIPDLQLLSVDPFLDEEGKPLRKAYKSSLAKLYRYPGNRLLLMTSMEASMLVPDSSLDFVYIDADHHFNFVMMDIIVWAQKVRTGGIVSGHDYIRSRGYGVVDAVNMYCKHNQKVLKLTEDAGSRGHSWYFVK